MTDTLPAGLTAKAVKLFASIEHQPGTCEALPALRCSFTGVVQPYERLELVINVTVQAGLSSGQLPDQLRSPGRRSKQQASLDASAHGRRPARHRSAWKASN